MHSHIVIIQYIHTYIHTNTYQINHPEKLSLEATMINQNFTQQVLIQEDGDSRKTVCMYCICMYVCVYHCSWCMYV